MRWVSFDSSKRVTKRISCRFVASCARRKHLKARHHTSGGQILSMS